MLKKRNTKNASKKSTPKTTKNNKRQTSLAEKTEQILLAMPKMIATQIGKDLVLQKQQEVKLKTEAKKLELQKKTLDSRFADLKKKTTQAAKKQAKNTQKNLQKTTKELTSLSRDLATTRQHIENLTQKKGKYSALQAQLANFEKEWAKNSSKKPTETAGKKKNQTQSKTQTKTRSETETGQGYNPTSNYENESQILEVIDMPSSEKIEFSQKEPEKM